MDLILPASTHSTLASSYISSFLHFPLTLLSLRDTSGNFLLPLNLLYQQSPFTNCRCLRYAQPKSPMHTLSLPFNILMSNFRLDSKTKMETQTEEQDAGECAKPKVFLNFQNEHLVTEPRD